jgi:hypothetical protein
LRGVASFIVVTGHVCTAFVPYLHNPAPEKNKTPGLFQLPFFRLCVGGRAAVAIFFFVMGYVNALNPLKGAYAGNTDLVLSNIARSCFTRTVRLVVPTGIATFVAWLFCQFGAFRLATRTDSVWIRMVSHNPDPTVRAALDGLLRSVTLFWHKGANRYDPVHWTLIFFLRGSMQIYLTLLATAMVRKNWRWAIVVLLYMYSWCTGDCKFVCPCLWFLSIDPILTFPPLLWGGSM